MGAEQSTPSNSFLDREIEYCRSMREAREEERRENTRREEEENYFPRIEDLIIRRKNNLTMFRVMKDVAEGTLHISLAEDETYCERCLEATKVDRLVIRKRRTFGNHTNSPQNMMAVCYSCAETD